jgi:hypothetical protein
MSVTNVVVDFNLNTSTSMGIEVFGEPKATITNKVIAAIQVPVSNLYTSASAALLEFSDVNNVIGGRRTTDAVAWPSTKLAALAGAIQASLVGSLDATNAAPFTTYAAGYKSRTSFGDLALASYAHSLFGHVDALAAISNDTTFKTKMNGLSAGEGQAALGLNLAELILSMSAAEATNVVKQVIGQDASRAKDTDNNDEYQKLEFRAGDKIYLSITLNAPTVTVLNTEVAQLSEPAGSLHSAVKYMIEITLSAAGL